MAELTLVLRGAVPTQTKSLRSRLDIGHVGIFGFIPLLFLTYRRGARFDRRFIALSPRSLVTRTLGSTVAPSPLRLFEFLGALATPHALLTSPLAALCVALR